jgi:hypothetical protein
VEPQDYDPKTVDARVARPWMWALGLVTIAALGYLLVPSSVRFGERLEPRVGTSDVPRVDTTSPQPTGTSGITPEPSLEGGIVHEIETITGANDGMALVGRRVDVHVDVQELANDTAFWVGPRDNRVLVVLARDRRSSADRQRGVASSHDIAALRSGLRAAVVGTIRAMPGDEGPRRARRSEDLHPGRRGHAGKR